jgi:hypothetical protein
MACWEIIFNKKTNVIIQKKNSFDRNHQLITRDINRNENTDLIR